jgi:hypothetical protein
MKQLELIQDSRTDAIFSDDRKHRYLLKRIWRVDLKMAMVVGLNPSTASKNKNDPTIRRLIGPEGLLGKSGYGGLYMVNLFTMVTPYPKQLIMDQMPATAALWWSTTAFQVQDVIFAWGAFKIPLSRDIMAKDLFPDALCWGRNQDGSPRHPLYLPGDSKLERYNLKTK